MDGDTRGEGAGGCYYSRLRNRFFPLIFVHIAPKRILKDASFFVVLRGGRLGVYRVAWRLFSQAAVA